MRLAGSRSPIPCRGGCHRGCAAATRCKSSRAASTAPKRCARFLSSYANERRAGRGGLEQNGTGPRRDAARIALLGRVMKRSVAILLCALLAACGGGGGGGSSTTPPPPPQSGLAKLTITIPSASGTSASRRRPAYISPSTRSVTISGSGVPTTTVAVGTNAPNCAPGSGGTVCTVNFPVPAGTATVTLATFASTDGSGTPLSTQSLTVTVTANAVTSIDVTLNGVVAALAISVSPDVLASGHASTSSVAVNALDASGNVIVGPGNYVNAAGSAVTVTLTDSDTSGATHLSQTSLTAPAASAISLSYNGAQIGNFTLSASASGIPIASAQV